MLMHVVNISSMARNIFGDSSHILEHENVHLLQIIISGKFIKARDRVKSIDTDLVNLNESSNLCCRIKLFNDSSMFDLLTKKGLICFSNLARNKQCEVICYLRNFENETTPNKRKINVINSNDYQEFFSENAYDLTKYLVNDNVYMFCKIIEKDKPLFNLDIPKDEKSAIFLSLYEEKLLTDFKIVCGGQEFCVHKMILCHSSVLKAMLQCPMKESEENVLTISDFRPSIVEIMIRYLYSGEMKAQLCEDELKQILLIANKYDLETLKTIALNEICKTIKTFTKALDVLLFAESNLLDMKDLIVKFIKENKQILLEE